MSKQLKAKDFMSQALHIDQRINNNIEQIHALRELATKATATLSDVKVSGTRDTSRMEDAIVRMVDLESDINEDVARLVTLKRDIVSVVGRIENPVYQTLLSLRYLCFKTWEQTAEAMSYSVQHAHRIHGGALEAVETILRHDRAG